MYQRLIEEYLTHYQPELKAELLRQHALPAYLESQAAAMLETHNRLLAELRARAPELSQVQRQLEAEQTVRELFLPLH